MPTRVTLINRVCYTVAIVSIVLGVVLSLAMIWTDVDPGLLRRFLLSLVIFLTASVITMGVNRALLTGSRD